MFNEKYNNGLSMFNLGHLITLLILSILLVLIIIFSKKVINNSKTDKVIRYITGSILLAMDIGYHIWIITRNAYSIDMIPFTGFCSLTNLLTVIYLFTNNKKMASIIVYYAVIGSFFSLIFVDTTYIFPHFRFIHYFFNHFVFLSASIYFYQKDRINLERKTFNKSSLYLISYTLILLVIDYIFNKNYFYLMESPVKEISDFFGKNLYGFLWIIFIYIFMNFWYCLFILIEKIKRKRLV